MIGNSRPAHLFQNAEPNMPRFEGNHLKAQRPGGNSFPEQQAIDRVVDGHIENSQSDGFHLVVRGLLFQNRLSLVASCHYSII